jgi:pentatricopeptide repeat domain-containing protein 1
MPDMGMDRDAITYSALISALSKGRQWGMAIDVFNHMVAEGVECDAVTCCSLITALDKGGQWQLAEQVSMICAVACSTTWWQRGGSATQ